MDASEEQERRRLRFTAWVRSTGATSRQIDEATDTNMGGHYTTAASQPAIMTREHLEQCRHLLGDVPEWVEREADIRSVESRNMAEREVVGVQKNAMSGWDMDGGTRFADRNITAPATPEAQQWSGWGTALKPALEPITVARKPLAGTVAANVLEHGTGALNVDGCRVGTGRELVQAQQAHRTGAFTTPLDCDGERPREYSAAGRWPANLIHDGSDEVVGLFPETAAGGHPACRNTSGYSGGLEQGKTPHGAIRTDSGSAARFFYTAKASKADRGEGNTHPTVKPLDLMAYLCRLVTPPGGIVLDPFMGSGTTIKAAIGEGFHAIGIERDPAYFAMVQQRLDGAQLGLPLA
jgi:site-specific DNA-methyltransferase (adenine-specific)